MLFGIFFFISMASAGCGEEQFECSSDPPRCIPIEWICDGKKDCENGRDETHKKCHKHRNESSCFGDQPECLHFGVVRCIRQEWICDGNRDCDKGEDERNCSYTLEEGSVHGLVFNPPLSNNDLVKDSDGVENKTEVTRQCLDFEFKCDSGECLLRDLVCNDESDCPDGSDEKETRCATPPKMVEPMQRISSISSEAAIIEVTTAAVTSAQKTTSFTKAFKNYISTSSIMEKFSESSTARAFETYLVAVPTSTSPTSRVTTQGWKPTNDFRQEITRTSSSIFASLSAKYSTNVVYATKPTVPTTLFNTIVDSRRLLLKGEDIKQLEEGLGESVANEKKQTYKTEKQQETNDQENANKTTTARTLNEHEMKQSDNESVKNSLDNYRNESDTIIPVNAPVSFWIMKPIRATVVRKAKKALPTRVDLLKPR